jgi:uncharacterized protein (TIGR00297 family)
MSSGPGLTRREVVRKLVHMAVGGIAFAVVYLGPFYSALCGLAALLGNLFVLPRLGSKYLWRGHEEERGVSIGIVLYPFSVLVLLLVFWQRLEVAAAVWGILAFGDGMASLAGKGLGGPALPWNPRKSWSGTLAYFFFGGAGAAALLGHTLLNQGAPANWPFWIAAAAASAAFAAFIESLPLGVDDNLSVPLLTAPLLFGLLLSEPFWGSPACYDWLAGWPAGLALNLVFAVLAYVLRSVDLSGAIAGTLLGALIFASAGLAGWSLLLAFFVLGTAATKLGYKRKAAAKLAQEKGGRRSARHAFANSGVAAACAFFTAATPHPEILLAAFAGAFATAAGDTISSEIGQLWGRRTFLITTLRPVPRGTDGAVSLEGTLAGLLASAAVAGLGAAWSLYSWEIALLVTLAAFLGTIAESVIGATLEQRGWVGNEAVNFLNTLCGAGLAALFTWLLLR